MSVMPVYHATAPEVPETARTFLESCSSTPATPRHLALVRSTAALLRTALDEENESPLLDLVAAAREWCANLHDVVAAAQQVVVDTLLASDVSASAVAARMGRLADIARSVLDALDRRPYAVSPVAR